MNKNDYLENCKDIGFIEGVLMGLQSQVMSETLQDAIKLALEAASRTYRRNQDGYVNSKEQP